MRGLGTLIVNLGLNAAEFTGGISKAEAQAIRASKEMQRNFQVVGQSLAILGTSAVGAAFALSKINDSVANFQDVSETIGDTAVNVASLNIALAQSGQELDGVADFSIKLTKALSTQDEEGKKAGAALKALGLDFQTLKNTTPVQQLEDIAKALNGFSDGPEKTAVLEALAKGGAKLIPFLNDLNDQGERQSKLTQQQIADSNEYVETLGKLKGQITGVAQVIASDAAPGMTKLINLIQEGVKFAEIFSKETGFLSGVLESLSVVVKGVSVAFVAITTGLAVAGKSAAYFAAQYANIFSGGTLEEKLRSAFTISSSYLSDVEALGASADKTILKILGIDKSSASVGGIKRPKIDTSGLGSGGASKSGKSDLDESIKDYQRLNKIIQEKISLSQTELSLGRELTEQEKFFIKLSEDARASKATASQIGLLADQADKLRALNSQLDLQRKNKENEKAYSEYFQKAYEKEAQDIEAVTKAREESDKRATRGIFDRLKSLEFENSLIGLNNEQRQSAVILRDIENSGIKKGTEEYENAAVSVNKFIEESKNLTEISQLWKDIESASRTAFEGVLTNAKDPFSALKNLIKKQLLDVLFELTAKQWIVDIKANFGSNVGGGDGKSFLAGFFSKLIGGFGGGSDVGTQDTFKDSIFSAGNRANGGPAVGGGLYQINERGTPEVFNYKGNDYLMAGQGGYVSNGATALQSGNNGGGGFSQVLNIDARGADPGSVARLQAVAAQIKADTLAAVQANANRGGSFARSVGRA